jgi:hypothetical protein
LGTSLRDFSKRGPATARPLIIIMTEASVPTIVSDIAKVRMISDARSWWNFLEMSGLFEFGVPDGLFDQRSASAALLLLREWLAFARGDAGLDGRSNRSTAALLVDEGVCEGSIAIEVAGICVK